MKKLKYCSFCGKESEEVEVLVAGPSVFICDECVEICIEVIAEHRKDENQETSATAKTLADLHRRLDILERHILTDAAPSETTD